MPCIYSRELQFTNVVIDKLKPYQNNARTHSDKQVQQIANSIREFGFMNPIVVDAEHRILAGHGRVLAAKKLGMKQVPVVYSNHLNEDQIRAYIIADNKIAANAGWDKDLLSIELQHLSLVTDLEFDIEVTGFEMAEIDILLDTEVKPKQDPADEIFAPSDGPSITKLGDLWQLGQHVLLCADATKQDSYNQLLQKKRIHMVFTDPPYNVRVNGHVCGNGKVKHTEFAMASGEMNNIEFLDFLSASIKHVCAVSRDGSLHYICMDWRHIDTLLLAGKQHYSDLKNICVWNKDNGGMGSLYRSKHEFVAVFKHGTNAHVNNIALGKHGRYRTNVWDYPGVNSFAGKQTDLQMHPTVKPVALVADAIKDCTKRGDAVLDPFAGSGTTLIAAQKTGRIAYAIELDPKYCDVIIRRWQKLTGQDAFHLDTFQTFHEIEGGSHA